jgi:polyphosphate kinase 2 (PPK2 family)
VAKQRIRNLLQAQPKDGRFRMADVDADSTPGLKNRKRLARDLKKHREKIFNLQERLYAEHKRSLLIVLQGMDTSGKDGTITHVIGGMDPQGVLISTFKQPLRNAVTAFSGAFASACRTRARSASSTAPTTRMCSSHASTTWRSRR